MCLSHKPACDIVYKDRVLHLAQIQRKILVSSRCVRMRDDSRSEVTPVSFTLKKKGFSESLRKLILQRTHCWQKISVTVLTFRIQTFSQQAV